MNQSLLVTKRDGAKEPISLEKIHRVIAQAVQSLDNVMPAELHNSVAAFTFESFAAVPHSKHSSEKIFSNIFTLDAGIHTILPLQREELSTTELLKVMCKLARSPPFKLQNPH